MSLEEKNKFNFKQKGQKSPSDESFIKLHKPPAITTSGTSTKYLPSDPIELCDRKKCHYKKNKLETILL